ncbi:VanZ family protein [Anaerotalea alkaliphila]|uniref:VanZ-like domain-containing protein n=1 Tax=Anaerotalea alkaliphila TaxID=2662126 RepID=A0A7X5HUP0_9FIRM|nr:VanZ family protein [Anaerotalea alkaliphila]NDL66982.1 hypothetical protein [Anaerotalea alkaliphila]
MKRSNIAVLLLLLTLAWAAVIFYFSSQPPQASYAQSTLALRLFRRLDAFFDITDSPLYLLLEGRLRTLWFLEEAHSTTSALRKSAHFGIYFILGILSCSFGYLYTRKLLVAFLLGCTLPVTVAVLDEYNQSFVDRISSLGDVVIDGFGALAGTLLTLTLILLFRLVRWLWGSIRKT